MREEVDPQTGLSKKVIVESRDAELRPRISIKDEHGATLKIPVSGPRGPLLPSRARQHQRGRGGGDRGGQHHRQDPAGAEEDPRHHGRSAARRRAVRGPQAQGRRDRRRDRRHRRRSARTPRASARSSSRPRSRAQTRREYLIPKGKHMRVQEGDRVRAGDRLTDGPVNPHDILRDQGRGGAAGVPGQRDPGGLPAAGREDQRQAHRGDRPPDAPEGAHRGSGRHRLPRGRAGRAAQRSGRERPDGRRASSRRRSSPCCSGSPRRALHRELHLGGLASRRPPGADRGGDLGQGRLPARAQGERHHGPPHPGRDGTSRYTLAE